jgi:hypothetical protein
MYAYQARGRFGLWKSRILDSVIKNIMMLVLKQREKIAEKVRFSHVSCKYKKAFHGLGYKKSVK